MELGVYVLLSFSKASDPTQDGCIIFLSISSPCAQWLSFVLSPPFIHTGFLPQVCDLHTLPSPTPWTPSFIVQALPFFLCFFDCFPPHLLLLLGSLAPIVRCPNRLCFPEMSQLAAPPEARPPYQHSLLHPSPLYLPTYQGKERVCKEIRIGKAGRGGAQGGVRLMATTAGGRKGFNGRLAVSCTLQLDHGFLPKPPPPKTRPRLQKFAQLMVWITSLDRMRTEQSRKALMCFPANTPSCGAFQVMFSLARYLRSTIR